MFGRVFARQIVTLVLALGIFLSGMAPTWAVPSVSGKGSMPRTEMTMPGMAMQNTCMTTMDKGTPGKGAPCKSTDAGCAVCTACALPVALIQASFAVHLLDRGEKAIFTHDVNPDSIAVLPALPPPILRA